MAIAASPRGSCAGDGCPTPETWPLLHVRYRGCFRRLCSSCVLKYHPGSFCSSCFEPPSPAPLVHCSRCPSVCHVSCLPSPSSPFLCPPCSTPNPSSFSFFPAASPLNPSSSRVLLAAARVALSSMRKAAAFFRDDAERKVRDSVLMRARARHLLEDALAFKRGPPAPPPDAPSAGAKRKSSADAVVAALAAQQRMQSRDMLPREDADVKAVRSLQDVPVVGNSNAPRGMFSGSANAAALHS